MSQYLEEILHVKSYWNLVLPSPRDCWQWVTGLDFIAFIQYNENNILPMSKSG